MKKAPIILMLVLFALSIMSCTQRDVSFNNIEFERNLSAYLSYVDSIEYIQDRDFVIVNCTTEGDTIRFSIYKSGGAYSMIHHVQQFVDYFEYKKYDLLIIGNFPNDVIQISKNNKINVIEDIIRVKFPQDYQTYLQNPYWVKPLPGENMEMVLTFYKDKFISCKRNYFG